MRKLIITASVIITTIVLQHLVFQHMGWDEVDGLYQLGLDALDQPGFWPMVLFTGVTGGINGAAGFAFAVFAFEYFAER